MPLPVIAGIGSDKLTVRKKAMVISHQKAGKQTTERADRSCRPPPPVIRLHAPPRNEGTAGSAGALDRHGFNFLNQLVERNWATPIEQLTRELLGARG